MLKMRMDSRKMELTKMFHINWTPYPEHLLFWRLKCECPKWTKNCTYFYEWVFILEFDWRASDGYERTYKNKKTKKSHKKNTRKKHKKIHQNEIRNNKNKNRGKKRWRRLDAKGRQQKPRTTTNLMSSSKPKIENRTPRNEAHWNKFRFNCIGSSC